MQQRACRPVAQLYDSPDMQLAIVLFGGQLHWGYWDESNPDAGLFEGADRLTQIMIDKVTIGEGRRFCDLGCGVGWPALRLARARGCSVDGFTISKPQQEEATRHARAEGLADRVQFFHADARAIASPDETYDGAWFFESIPHMGHRPALREANRVLKPGATLLLTDLPTLPTADDEFERFAETSLHSSFVSMDEYPTLFGDAGFELTEVLDITPNVTGRLVEKLEHAFVSHQAEVEASGLTEEQIQHWIHVFGIMARNLAYLVITARKK